MADLKKALQKASKVMNTPANRKLMQGPLMPDQRPMQDSKSYRKIGAKLTGDPTFNRWASPEEDAAFLQSKKRQVTKEGKMKKKKPEESYNMKRGIY